MTGSYVYTYDVPLGSLVLPCDEASWDPCSRNLIALDGPMICCGMIFSESGEQSIRFLTRRGLVHLWWTKVGIIA